MNRQQVELFWILKYDYVDGWVLKKHKHPFFQIIYIVDGTGEGTLGKSTFDLERDLIIVIPPNHVHSLAPASGSQVKTLDTKFQVHDRRLKKELHAIPSPVMAPDQSFKHILELIHEEGYEKKPHFHELCQALFLELIVGLLRMAKPHENTAVIPDHSVDTVEDPIVVSMLDALPKFFNVRNVLDAIGYELGYSRRYLSGRFKDSMGVTFQQYLYSFRIEQAKKLIAHHDYPIKEVAFLTGFKSIHHFTRTFTANVGTPPGKWRSIEREKLTDVTFSPTFTNILFLEKR